MASESTTISHRLTYKELKQVKIRHENLETKINRVNKVIKSATIHGGYVCGAYVSTVLVPLSQKREVVDFSDIISLRFPTFEHLMRFLCDKSIVITDVDTTPWDEPEYLLYIKNSRNDSIRYNITISPNGLIKDVDINQLTATINDHTGAIIFSSSDHSLVIQDLIQSINDKHVKIRAVCYSEAMTNNIIYNRLQRAIVKYTREGWTVDQSERPENYRLV